MSDIRFYDFDFNLLYILPEFANKAGYISINTEQQMNDSGALEIVFVDSELKRIIEEKIDNILVIWEDFQGFLTSYRWDNQMRITGMHLNGLLHRNVIPNTSGELTGNVGELTRSAINKNIQWLKSEDETSFEKEIKYSTDKYLKADKYIQDLLNLDSGGFQIKADIKNKQYILEFIKAEKQRLMLSQNNLNAYDFEITYINKELSYGGWYEKKQEDKDPEWCYISLDENKEGIYKIDTVLSSNSEIEALNELKKLKAEKEVTAKTRNIKYLEDYKLGDIIRVQEGGITNEKIIIGIKKWKEKEYGEQPILTEVTANE